MSYNLSTYIVSILGKLFIIAQNVLEPIDQVRAQ